jgi:hypothetical protein
MKSGNPIANGPRAAALSTFTTLTALICLCAGASPFAQSMARDRFWKDKENPDSEYERFLKINGDRGFSCTLDGKSSYAFRIIGDSITTPMNGMDHIQFFSGLPDVVISGEEKGEPYSTRYIPLEGGTYPAVCLEEEAAYPTTGIASGNGRKAGARTRGHGGHFRIGFGSSIDILGRMAAPSKIP